MKNKYLISALFALLPMSVFAQASDGIKVPKIATDNKSTMAQSMPPSEPTPVNLHSGVQYPLNAKEKKGVALADEWKRKQDFPSRGQDGSVVFLYGATLPSVVCAPLYVCNLQLQKGENIIQVDVADNVRWKVTPTTYGAGAEERTVLVIKPTDSGLQTDMTIATDRRLYIVKLVSRVKDWMPLISFAYPDDLNAKWAAYHAERTKQIESTVIPTTGQNIAHLDFGFVMSGDSPAWKPTRVYSDGLKTYIQFPPSIKSMKIPALVAIGGNKKEQLVNYRIVGNTYVVDQLIQTAALISGVGNSQIKVYISRERRFGR